MPRACTICTHPDRDAIDKAIAGGTPIAEVAAQYRVSGDALSRHRAKHIPAVLQRVVQLEATAHAFDVQAELRRLFERSNLLYDACDRWLRDPDDPTRYDIGPRADDVRVTYLETTPGGKTVRKKAPLSELLARLENGGVHMDGSEYKHADPRELVLKTAERLHGQIELVAKLLDQKDLEKRVAEVEARLAASGK